jgi:hypothetical protein
VSIEDKGHIVSGLCPVYEDLRTQFGDLGEDKNLVEYFTAVLDRRDKLEEDDRRQQSQTVAVLARVAPVAAQASSVRTSYWAVGFRNKK